MSKEADPDEGPDVVRTFTKALLTDLQALEAMLGQGMIESGIRRFGCEQEIFLVNRAWRPAPVSVEVLARIDHEAFTTELARFNLEMNLEPRELDGECFTWLEGRITELVGLVRDAARAEEAEVVLAGILPTLSKSDLSLDNITPLERYHALNEALTKMRGGAYRLRIEGTDELHIEHDSVMLEACNTSCQVHLQVEAEEFAKLYNVSQLAIAPVLASCVNSPLLFGRRLWAETRIALFQQSLDTRSSSVHLRNLSSRVRFGDSWVKDSVSELFQQDIAEFRVLIAKDIDEDPFEVLDRGGVPKLKALQLHNGTVYRWNRPCYGVGGGKPHLRIECRALPAGPTIRDEVANAAFWIGLVLGMAEEYGDVTKLMDFDDAKSNFLAAARHGLSAGFQWVDGENVPAPRLITETLLPLARNGLAGLVDSSDIDTYMGLIEERVASRQTGAVWARKSLAAMKGTGTRGARLTALTAATWRRQAEGKPGHEWALAELSEAGEWQKNFMKIEQYMTTSLFTVHEDELVEMVAFLMDRKQIRHVPVEDGDHRLVGLVSYRSILRMVSEMGRGATDTSPVKLIMEEDPVTVAPETSTLEAMDLMKEHKVSCLPVCKNGKLVGLVSERDFMPLAYQLLGERLAEPE